MCRNFPENYPDLQGRGTSHPGPETIYPIVAKPFSKIFFVGAGFMPARNPGESESSGGGEPRPYEKNISRYTQLFTPFGDF